MKVTKPPPSPGTCSRAELRGAVSQTAAGYLGRQRGRLLRPVLSYVREAVGVRVLGSWVSSCSYFLDACPNVSTEKEPLGRAAESGGGMVGSQPTTEADLGRAR